MSNDSPHKEAPSQGEAGLEPEVLNSTPDTLGLVVAEMMKEENRDRQLAINVSEEARKIDPDLLASTVALHKFFSPRLGKDSQGRDRVVLLMPEHEHGDKSDRELKIGSRYGSILPVSKDYLEEHAIDASTTPLDIAAMIGVDGSKTAELIDGSHILVSVDHHPINPKDPAGLEEFSYENRRMPSTAAMVMSLMIEFRKNNPDEGFEIDAGLVDELLRATYTDTLSESPSGRLAIGSDHATTIAFMLSQEPFSYTPDEAYSSIRNAIARVDSVNNEYQSALRKLFDNFGFELRFLLQATDDGKESPLVAVAILPLEIFDAINNDPLLQGDQGVIAQYVDSLVDECRAALIAENDDSRIVVALAKETLRDGAQGNLQITLRTAASSESLTVDVGRVAETFKGAGGRPHAAGGIQAELDRNSPEDDQLIDLAELIAAGVKKANEIELATNKD